MTPAERLILRVLAEEYERQGNDPAGTLGPYGRAGDRLGLRASRVAYVEMETVGWLAIFTDYPEQASHIREAL